MQSQLSSAEAAVLDLVAAVTAADGVEPLNEDAQLGLHRAGDSHWTLATGDHLDGYAQLSAGFGTAQLCVHPDSRRRGHGTALLRAVLDAGATGVWGFGGLGAARALATREGLSVVRELLRMERRLDPDLPNAEAGPGFTLRAFADGDAEAFLAVNAAAFAQHPEQGAFSAADLAQRKAEPWWDTEDLILAVSTEPETRGAVLGFHWLKRHDAATGEVYVIGVDPSAHGRGLGTVLLNAGLHRLAATGCTRVLLYVEADNPAVHLYERTGFRTAHSDVLFARRHTT